MEATAPKEYRIFFSWQSDSPAETNSRAIRGALKAAEKTLTEKNPGLKFILDEATRDTAGSPNIADKIFEKIEIAQIYIADISTVTLPGAPRPCANPNVLFELGYAIAQVGWDRTILLLNKAIGKFPTDLPFDIAQNRVSDYQIAPASENSVLKAKTKDLQSLLERAIQIIIDKNPKTPRELRGLSPDKIRHERDVESLNLLFSRFNIETIQQHIEELPRRILGSSFWFWEGFKGVVDSDSFHVYDQIVEESIYDLYTNWQHSYRFVGRYHDAGDNHVFANPGDAPLDLDQQTDWDQIDAARIKMAIALRKLLERVRDAFVEVNTKKLSDGAWHEYAQMQKKLKERWDF